MSGHDRQRLQRKREKLDRLVDEALENGTPISKAHEIMKQSRKVQELMLEFDTESEESN